MFRTFGLIVWLGTIMVASCSESTRVRPVVSTPQSGTTTATPGTYITKEQVIEIAKRISNTPRIYQVQDPSKIDARLLTIEQARQELDKFPDIVAMLSPHTNGRMVWLVMLEGEWYSGVPGGIPAPTPGTAQHLIAVLEAETGSPLLIQLRP